jgi:hypothetical protein
MILAVAVAAVLATPESSSESYRVRAASVYVGTVAEVRKVGTMPPDGGSTESRMEATLRDVKVLRGAAPADAAAGASVRYSQWDPPFEGGQVQYRLAAGEVAVVFGRSLSTDYPAAMVNGPARAVGALLRERRDWLAALDPDALRAQGVTEAQRPEQVKLYDRILEALGQPLQ